MNPSLALRDEHGDSLKTFLKQNTHTLSALGVFAALTVLSENLPNPTFKYVLSCLWLVGMILVWFEIYFSMPKMATLRLFLFHYVLLFSGLALITYCLYEFRALSNAILFVPLSVVVIWFVVSAFVPLLERSALAKKVFGFGNLKKTTMQHITISVVVTLIMLGSFAFASLLSLVVNSVFNVVKQMGE